MDDAGRERAAIAALRRAEVEAAQARQRPADQAEAARRSKAAWLARYDAQGTSQRCIACNIRFSPFGYGPPITPDRFWTCRDHRITA